jgi:4-carboxymuconolactone decarboxylase
MGRWSWMTLTGVIAAVSLVSLSEPKPGSAQANNTATASRSSLPHDVYAESLNRLPLVKREELDERAQKLYDSYGGSGARSLAGLQGPAGIRLHSPRLAVLNEPLNTYLRFDTEIPRKLSELAILVTARELDSQFEWTAHEPAAIKEGLDPNVIDAVKNRKATAQIDEKEAVIISIGRELFGKRNLSSATFARGLNAFGKKGFVDLITLMTNYASTSFFLSAFDMQLRPDQPPLLPIP